MIRVVWSGEDIMTLGSISTEGGRPFSATRHTRPAGYVNKNTPDVSQMPVSQLVGLPDLPLAHWLYLMLFGFDTIVVLYSDTSPVVMSRVNKVVDRIPDV
ncbi:hypothetical protein R1flu_019522 [Riccia fluitans]|uniref:Uncharacterized protein n=1 Tax=Riccia fluitans TaxID=41844 RepID=A0ABD1ZMQ2_9MARC